jgi:protein O-GlcNAc transferase
MPTPEEALLAIADYTRAITLRPDRPNAYQNRGNAYRQQERWAEAEADYAKAFELAPGYTGARANWNAVRRAQGKPTDPA